MSDNDYWADSAPQYKIDGEMYANVEYDHESEPRKITVTQDQLFLAAFELEEGTAILSPKDFPTHPESGEDVENYVSELPFVDGVEMEP